MLPMQGKIYFFLPGCKRLESWWEIRNYTAPLRGLLKTARHQFLALKGPNMSAQGNAWVTKL